MSADSRPAPSAPAAKPHRRRLLKWTVGTLVVLVALFAALPMILSTSLARDAIHAWLADNVDRKVDFDKLDVGWFQGIRIQGLRVSDAGGEGKPLLAAPLVEIDAPLLPVLFKKIRVRRFVVHDPVLFVAQRDGSESNVAGVVKTRRVQRRPKSGDAPKAPSQPQETAAAEVESVLPEIHVPVEIRNLTLVYRNREGREARQAGISFRGLLDTREGPTTFDLNVLDGAGGAGITLSGSVALFESDGTPLPAAMRRVDATLKLHQVDARENRDFLALYLHDAPAEGVLDGHVEMHLVGTDASGDIDLHLRGLGYGEAAKAAASRTGDDLAITGKFAKTGATFRLDGFKVRAEGLAVDADASGTLDAPSGRATIDADLARVGAAARAIGIPLASSPEAGALRGALTFTPSPARATGDFTLTGFRAAVKDGPPVAVDEALIRFEASSESGRYEIGSIEVKLADIAATGRASYGPAGAIDASLEAKGNLGGLLERARRLGRLTSEFAVSGTVDAALRVTGTADAPAAELSRFVLTETDVRIEAAGTRAADGALDFRASGKGDLGNLLRRAKESGAGPQGIEGLHGRFAFEISAKGRPDALVVDVPQLHVEGDVNVEAHGTMTADGRLDAQVADVSGSVNDLLLLLRRMGFLDRDLSMDGRFAATAVVQGTCEKPEVPRCNVKITGGPLAAEANGSVAANGAIDASATVTGDLAVLADLALKAGLVTEKLPASGFLTAHAKAAGTRDKVAIPQFDVSVANGPTDLNVSGSYGADGRIAATASASGDLDRLVKFAAAQGWVKRAVPTGCTYTMRAVATGPKDRIEIPEAKFAMNGPLRLDVDARMSAEREFSAQGRVNGALQPLADLAAAWSGEEARRIEGTVRGEFAASGKPDRFDVRVPALALRSATIEADLEGGRSADGKARGSLKAAGAIADFLALARSFGVATEVEATGRVDTTVTGSMTGSLAEGSMTLFATDLVVATPQIGDGTFREPRLTIALPALRYDLDAKRLDPAKAQLTMSGAKTDLTKVALDGDVLSLDGRIDADATFAKGHPELLSGASFTKLAGTFSFAGDVTQGREKAKDWKGGFELDAQGVTAPHVNLTTAKLPGKIADGVVTIDPIKAVLNGGPVEGSARIGLVGEKPDHHLKLTGKDVELDSDLAPLVAHASPLFALGEDGKTGGKASIDLDLTARGFGAAQIKKTLTGKGTVGLADAFVQSTGWIKELLDLAGTGGRLDLAKVTVPFEVKDSKVQTGELPMEGLGLLLRMGGYAGLDGKLDYALRVKPKSGGGKLAELASLFDADGYLPLRLGGTISKPRLKLPDLKDVLKSGLGGLLDRGKKDDDPPKEKPEPKKKPKKKPGTTEEPAPEKPPATDEPPPPPPPGPAEPKKDEPPPPPPSSEPKKDEPPPPPPPGEKKTEEPPPPPPPPPPPEKRDDPPPPPPPK